MKTTLIIKLIVIFFSSFGFSQVTTHNGIIWNIIGPNAGAWDLKNNVAVWASEPDSIKDMRNFFISGMTYYSGWTSTNNTLFVVDNNFDYENVTSTIQLKSAFLTGTPTDTIYTVSVGDKIIAKLRGTDEYVAIKITSVNLTGMDNLDNITFEYKKNFWAVISDQNYISTCTGINFYSGDFYTSWQWYFPGAIPSTSLLQNPTNILYNLPGSYSVTLITSDGVNTDTIIATDYIHVLPLIVNAGTDQTITCGASTTITTTNNYTGTDTLQYNWYPADGLNNTNLSIPTANPITNINYIVTVTTPSGGCTATDTVLISNSISTYNQEICLVTIDSLSQYNIIIWDKPIDPTINSFLIYRDTANYNFGLIGEVPYTSVSEFVDTARNIYSANGDPNYASWRYKIAVKDICGNISNMSPYHQTIFLQHNGGNFSWSEYKIEGQSLPVPALSNYLFQRDNLSNGNFITIATLGASSISTTDPNYSTYQDSATWRVITAWSISCEPTKAGGHNSTRSNVQRNFVFSVPLLSDNNINLRIFPNPTKGKFTIEITDLKKSITNSQLCITNIQGEIIYQSKITNSKTEIDLSVQASGIYIVTINSGEKVYHQKLVKE